jgi:hypothetical protein
MIMESGSNPVEIDRFTAKMDWSKKWKGVIDWTKEHIHDWDDELQKMLNEAVADFYAKNPRKRNSERYVVETDVRFSLLPRDSALDIHNKIKEEYRRIGMYTIWLHSPESLGKSMIEGQSSDRAAATDPSKIKTKTYSNIHRYNGDSEYGNGYHNLPGTTIAEYREKLLSCIKNTEVIVEKQMGGYSWSGTTYAQIIVHIVPVYDKSKLNKLYDLVSTDPELQDYARRLDSISRGIDAYYAEKAARGDHYTGD